MPPPDRTVSCIAVQSEAAEITDNVGSLVLELDGVRYSGLARHRQATHRCFDMGARTAAKFKVYPSAANGYYVMLRPLAPGRHTLNFGGALSTMLQAVTYTLIVP
jgi:hypothetical protein